MDTNVPVRLVATKKSLVFLECVKPSNCCVLDVSLQDNMLMGAFRSSRCNIYNRLVSAGIY